MDFQGVSWILFFVYVTSEQEDQNQSHSLIEGKMTTQSVTWSATAFKRLFFSEVISGNGWCSFFYLRRVFEYDAQSNEILSLQSKIEITFWWLNAKWKISNLATWNLNPCNFSPFWIWKKAVWHKSLILSLMYEEGRNCLNVDQTQLYCMTCEAEKKYISTSLNRCQERGSSHYCSLWWVWLSPPWQ